jgi:hypothetical protein
MTSKEVTEPENAIISIAEIPQVLKEEKVQQPVIYLTKIIEDKERNVVLLGETHIATKGEERAAGRILPYFKCIGCEGLNVEGYIEGKFFFLVMHYIINPFFGIVFFLGRRSENNKSFIEKAYEYCDKVLLLEKGWKPSIRTRIFFVALPILFIREMYFFATSSIDIASEHGSWQVIVNIASIMLIVILLEKMPVLKNISRYIFGFILGYIFDLGPSRERNMTKNLIAELNKDETIDTAIVLTGSNHTRPIAKILKNKYGFVEKDF